MTLRFKMGSGVNHFKVLVINGVLKKGKRGGGEGDFWLDGRSGDGQIRSQHTVRKAQLFMCGDAKRTSAWVRLLTNRTSIGGIVMKPVCPVAHRCVCTFSKHTIYPVPYQHLPAIFLFLRNQVTKPLPIETYLFLKGLGVRIQLPVPFPCCCRSLSRLRAITLCCSARSCSKVWVVGWVGDSLSLPVSLVKKVRGEGEETCMFA